MLYSRTRLLPTLALLLNAACFGNVGETSSTGPAPVVSTAPDAPRPPQPTEPAPEPVIPPRPFGPAAEVKPAPARCDELGNLPIATSPDGQQHVWQYVAGRAPRSMASGVLLGEHRLNELLAAGSGMLAVQTYTTRGSDFLHGLVMVDVATGQAIEAMPLGPASLRTADHRRGEFAFAGYASARGAGQRIFLARPPAAPTELAVIPGVDYVRVRLTPSAVLAQGGGRLYRVERTPGQPVRTLGTAEHFTWNDADEVTGTYWSEGNRIYRSGSATPLLVLSEAKHVLALGFDPLQQKLYFATELGLSRVAVDGSAREDILKAAVNSAPGPVANDQWIFPTGRGDIYAYNGRVRAPVNCYDNADLSNVVPYEVDTNTGRGRWLSDDPAYPFLEGTASAHFDSSRSAHYVRY